MYSLDYTFSRIDSHGIQAAEPPWNDEPLKSVLGSCGSSVQIGHSEIGQFPITVGKQAFIPLRTGTEAR
jgi:hypothetical protein